MENNNESTYPELLKRIENLEREVARMQEHLNRQGTLSNSTPAAPAPAPGAPPVRKEIKKQPAGPKISLENAIGTRWIGRVGMLAVIFGIAFFLKYSFDNRLIGETGRIILGIIGGISFIAGGEFFQRKKGWSLYGQILTGGGIAILYFSIYAAYAFYHLIPQVLAFGALIAITTTAILLSVRYTAISVVAIGILGGFLTPVMLSTGENKPLSLFSYILLLDAGILTVAWFRRWDWLPLASLAGTVLIYIGWHFSFYTPEQQALAFGIVTIYFLLYNLWTFLKGKSTAADMLLVFGSAAFYLLAVYVQNQFKNDWQLKSFILGLTFVEVAMADLSRRVRTVEKSLLYSFLATSFVCNVIALFILFEKGWLSGALAAEMVAFSFIGLRLNSQPLRNVSYVLALFCLGQFQAEIVLQYGPFEKFIPFLNHRFLTCGSLIAAFYLLLFLLARDSEKLSPNERIVIPASLVLTQVLSIILLSFEVSSYFRYSPAQSFSEIRYAQGLSLSVLWTVYASAMIGAGILKKARILRLMGILLAGAAIIKVFLFDLSALQTIYRIVSFIVLGMILLVVSYLYNRFKYRIFGDDGHV
jgi:uncharacterized membrane protein